MKSTMMSVPLNLAHFLERAGKLFGKQEIVSRMPDKSLHRYTYADFYRACAFACGSVDKAGLKRGDRVATLMWNHYADFESYFGAIVAGGVLHTLNLRLAPDDIAFIASHAKDRFLIVDDVLLPLFEQFRAKSISRASSWCRSPVNRWPMACRTTRHFSALRLAGSSTPKWTRTRRARCVTPRARRASPRAWCIRTARRCCTRWSRRCRTRGIVRARCVVAGGADVSRECLGYSLHRRHARLKMVFPGPHLHPDDLFPLLESEQVTLSCGVPTIWLPMARLVRWRRAALDALHPAGHGLRRVRDGPAPAAGHPDACRARGPWCTCVGGGRDRLGAGRPPASDEPGDHRHGHGGGRQ